MNTKPLPPDEVRTIAHLARLRLDDTAARRLGTELASMLAMVGSLADESLDDVEPMAMAPSGPNRLAEDEPGAVLSAEQLARLAPEMQDGFFSVPRVLGDDQ